MGNLRKWTWRLFGLIGLIALIAVLFGVLVFITEEMMKAGYGNSKTDFFGALSGVATAVATMGGLILLLVTFVTYLETRRQRISREEPTVSVRLQPDENTNNSLNIVFANTGGGPAYDIQVKFSPDLPYGDSSLNRLTMFKRTALLDSGEQAVFFYDSYSAYMDSGKPKVVMANITYYDLPKEKRGAKRTSREIELNFEERYGQMQLVKRDMNDLVTEIEELKHAVILSALERGDRNV